MPNLKDIRRRIKSVKSTQKITQAMRMVAAAKVKRAENRVKAGRAYTQALRQMFSDVFHAVRTQPGVLGNSPYRALVTPRPVQNLGIVVLTSDRGLCGSYNSAVIRQALRLEKEVVARGLTPKFYLVGNKAIQAFSRYSQAEILGRMSDMTAAPGVHDANRIAETLTKAFEAGQIDSIDVLSTHFVSMISYKLQMTPVIPLTSIIQLDDHPVVVPTLEHVQDTVDPHQLKPELLLEPDPTHVLEKLLPMYLGNTLYLLLLEAAASELAARMTAMSNASKNAGEMIDRLTIVYNKARQASITQELLEVVAGAEALK